MARHASQLNGDQSQERLLTDYLKGDSRADGVLPTMATA